MRDKKKDAAVLVCEQTGKEVLDCPWESFADEYVHYVRGDNPLCPVAYEHVFVGRVDKDTGLVPFLHTVFFPDDYAVCEQHLDAVMQHYGYRDLDEWVQEMSPAEIPRGEDGRLVKEDPNYIVDWKLLGALIIADMADNAAVWMTEEAALALVRHYVKEPACIG